MVKLERDKKLTEKEMRVLFKQVFLFSKRNRRDETLTSAFNKLVDILILIRKEITK